MSAGPSLCLGTSIPNDLFLKSKIGRRLRKNSDLAQDICSTNNKNRLVAVCSQGQRTEPPLLPVWDHSCRRAPRPGLGGHTRDILGHSHRWEAQDSPNGARHQWGDKGARQPRCWQDPMCSPRNNSLFHCTVSGSQGQRQRQPELTLRVPRPFRKILIILDRNVSFFPALERPFGISFALFLMT